MDPQPSRQEQDLGLGFKVIQQQRTRFINRDGTFNVRRRGIPGRGAFSLYHAILAISWTSFYAIIFIAFILANAVFAAGYFFCGRAAFPELANLPAAERYVHLFLYGIQILTTLGASPLHPMTLAGNIILAVQSVTGLLGFALGTGLIFARFSNPATKIIFSNCAVIAPYKDITGFMFRIINGRSNELIDVTANVTLAVIDQSGQRVFQQLSLERDKVNVFPLNWTIVHPIDENSPLWGKGSRDLGDANAEFLITITAIDKDLSKTAYARLSYLYKEVAVGARFVTMIEQTPDGMVVADANLLSKIEKVK